MTCFAPVLAFMNVPGLVSWLQDSAPKAADSAHGDCTVLSDTLPDVPFTYAVKATRNRHVGGREAVAVRVPVGIGVRVIDAVTVAEVLEESVCERVGVALDVRVLVGVWLGVRVVVGVVVGEAPLDSDCDGVADAEGEEVGEPDEDTELDAEPDADPDGEGVGG